MKLKSNSTLVEEFTEYTKDPTKFLSIQTELESKVKFLLKQLYDLTKQTENDTNTSTLPNLVIDNFDTEQIWQQIELQNQFIADELSKQFTQYFSENVVVPSDNEEDSEAEDESEEDENSDDDDSSDNNVADVGEEDLDEDEIENEDLEDEEIDNDMREDEDAMQSDDSIDYFQEIPSDDENDPAKNKDEKSFGPRYHDFFEDPEVLEKRLKSDEKKVRFDLDDEDVLESSDEEKENVDTKSSYEMRQERLRQRVEQLENEALSEKPWHMIGEVTAKKRPQNSLLEQNLEFDFTVRPAPVITEEVTLKLEDIILQRIKDRAWDDVERKIKPIDGPQEFKKKVVLDQEKSKLSLAQVYEQEYLKQKEAVSNDDKKVEEEPREHQLLKARMNSLFQKLDALSNYHFTPRPSVQEVKVITNLPALTIEEATPATISEATLAAPEEILEKKKGDLVGKEERTSTDKNRSRRQKKRLQRAKFKELEKKNQMMSKLKPGMANKEKLKKDIEKLSKNKLISHFKEDTSGKQTKSSKQFFEKLEDTITNKDKIRKRKTIDHRLDAKKVKL